MKKYKRELLAMLLVLAACMLWSGSAGRYAELDREYKGVSLRFETTPLNIDGLYEIRRRQKDLGTDFKLTAWKQDYNLEIEDPDLGICIESDVIYMWGDGKGMWGYTGCSMSSDVTGIIAVKKDNYKKDEKFVSLDMESESDGDEAGVMIEEFILQNSYSADSVINYSDMVSVTGNFLIFPALTIFACMFVRLMAGFYYAKKHKKGLRIIAYYVFLLVLWVCICFFAGSFFFEISGSFIPTKWSDFDFWSGLAERYRDNLSGLRLTRDYFFDVYFAKSFIYIFAGGLLSSACFAAALRLMRNKSLNMLMIVETASAFIMFYAAAVSGAQYGRYACAYRFILPVYFLFDFFINNFKLRERT